MFKKSLSYNLFQKISGHRAYSSAFILLILLLYLPSANAQAKYLEPDNTISQEIKPNQKHLFRIRMGAGNFFRISVQQQPGVDLILTLYDAKHRKLATVGGYRGFLKMDQ